MTEKKDRYCMHFEKNDIIEKRHIICILQSKNSEENLLREKEEEKNAMMEKIGNLEEERRTQAQEIIDLQEKVKIINVCTLETYRISTKHSPVKST